MPTRSLGRPFALGRREPSQSFCMSTENSLLIPGQSEAISGQRALLTTSRHLLLAGHSGFTFCSRSDKDSFKKENQMPIGLSIGLFDFT